MSKWIKKEVICNSCHGSGIYFYKNKYSHTGKQYTCDKCKGSGKITINWFLSDAEEENNKIDNFNIPSCDILLDEYNLTFFADQGFDSEGYSYIIIGDTYTYRDQLKKDGAKYNKNIKHWIIPYNTLGRYRYYKDKLNVNSIYKCDNNKHYRWNSVYSTDGILKELKEYETEIELKNIMDNM